MEDDMRYRKSIRVTYSVKSEDGFIVERRQKFESMNEAIMFLNELKQYILIGRPIVEEK